MSTKKDFTTKEWNMLTEAPFLMGFTVSDFDMSGSSSVKEFDAIIKCFDEAKEKYKDNQLIQAVLEESGGITEFENGIAPDKDVVIHFKELAAMLDSKQADFEAVEFKQFLYWIGWKVANAYGEGFLGMGDKVSMKESYILEKLKEALGV